MRLVKRLILITLCLCLCAGLILPCSAAKGDENNHNWGKTHDWYVFYVTSVAEDFSTAQLHRSCRDCNKADTLAYENPFTDLQQKWYVAPIFWAAANNISSGTGNGKFSPNLICSRAQAVSLLWNVAGKPEPEQTEPMFTDVADSSLWYYKAVAWAVEQGITSGTGNGCFSPNAECTRGQIVMFLWRFAGQPEPEQTEPMFTDVANSSLWYYKAVAWAVEQSITSGTQGGKFSPDVKCDRAQIVTFLYRYSCREYGKQEHPHLPGDVTLETVTPPTCAQEGLGYSVTYCGLCGIELGREETAIETLPHTYTDPAAVTLPTASERGYITYTCTVCGYQYVSDYIDTSLTMDCVVYVNGRIYFLGEPKAALGTPDEILTSFHEFQWYVYGTKDYKDFVICGVKDGKVVAIETAGKYFSYQGITFGTSTTASVYQNRLVEKNCKGDVRLDKNDGNTVYGVKISTVKLRSTDYSAAALAGESKVSFHVTNAFRLAHGMSVLLWEKTAAECARAHSQDMANKGYTTHTSPSGVTAEQRLTAAGIPWKAYAENISAGYSDGFEAVYSWVKSSAHRKNMLSDMTYMGIGAGYNASNIYKVLYTQILWK